MKCKIGMLTYAAESLANVRLVVFREFRKSNIALKRFNVVCDSRDNLAEVLCYFLSKSD